MFFVFLKERDINWSKITYLAMFLTDVGYRNLIELTLSG